MRQPQTNSNVELTDEQVAEELRVLLVNQNATLSVAESCTGGLLSAELVNVAGISSVYRGGVVSYDNEVKIRVLNVPQAMLSANGAVSRPVASAMALGVRHLLESTWGCGVTGIAGPGGGSVEKPVGTVCIAVSGPGVEWVEQKLFSGSRLEIRRASVRWALEMLSRALQSEKLKGPAD